MTNPEVEWLPRKLIGPLQEEFQAKIDEKNEKIHRRHACTDNVCAGDKLLL